MSAPPGGRLARWFRRDGKRYRTWPQRLLLTLNSLLVVVCLAAAGGLAVAYNEASDVDRVLVGDYLADREGVPAGEPLNVLVVGIDDAAGLADDDPVLNERELGTLNSDTIMILRVDPGTKRAAILSFPRDLYVKIAGGSKARINTALATGGPETLIETIWENYGIPIHHYVQVDFAAFKAVVQEVGGVPVHFPTAVRDRQTGLFVPVAGCTVLEPDQALAYVRSRHYQTNIDGKWVTDISSDLGRISRQQDFIRRVLKKGVASGWRDPGRIKQLVDIAQDNVKIDETLTTGEMLDLALDFRSFNPDTLDLYSLPVDGKELTSGAQVLLLREAEAEPILARFRGGSPPEGTELATEELEVEVHNGSGVPGQAADAAAALRAVGVTVVDTDDADRDDYATTTVRYGPGQVAAAVELARRLPGTPAVESDDELTEGVIRLITGADYAEILAEPRPAEELQWVLDAEAAAAEAAAAVTTTSLVGEVPPEAPPEQRCE